MNKLILIGILATASTVSAQAQASASPRVAFYVTPSVVIAFPGDFDNAAGGALAFGVTINNVHSIEAEVISFKTHEGSDDFKFTPVLATYKHSFVLTSKISLMAGASIGATLEKIDYHVPSGPGGIPGGGGNFYSSSETAFTAGLVGGMSYSLNNRVSLDANVHLLKLNETDITTSGNMVLVTLGAKIRF